jgi:hypothetical protein
MHGGWNQILAAIGFLYRNGDLGFDAAKLIKEIDMEIGSAEFTIGDALQANILLECDNLGDCAILNRPELLGVDLTTRLLFTGIEQVFRAQEATDMIGAKRRRCASAHGIISFRIGLVCGAL